MYLQIKIREEDQQYLRFLWRKKDDTVQTYQFNRLIFGLKPASYIATKCLHCLAEDEGVRFPEAARILRRDLYVDDLLTGADSLAALTHLQRELTCLLKEGGFNLRQCASNSVEVMQAMPDRCVNLQLHESGDTTLKTLGVYWDSASDRITYTVQPFIERKSTKRIIFSEVARIYDPLGLLNPVVVNAKLLIQELWKLGVDWDESLPAAIHTKWQAFASDLPALNEMSFDRQVLWNHTDDIELHGFCDASERAYGACIYLTSTDSDGGRRACLLCAKSRVAPVKTAQTIPRLELCAALLLANLFSSVKSSLPTGISRSVFWTDSMITYHWINTSPHQLKSFVANRVSSIRSLTNPEDWRHVRTNENPADLLSRGVKAHELRTSVLWTRGPSWLSGEESAWPLRPTNKYGDLPEQRSITCLTAKAVKQGAN